MLSTESMRIVPEVLSLIARIDGFKSAWQSSADLSPQRLQKLRRSALVQSVLASIRSAGGKLSARQVERLLTPQQSKPSAAGWPRQAAAYAALLEQVFDCWQQMALDPEHIERFHEALLLEHVAAEPAAAPGAPAVMSELLAWVEQERVQAKLHPLLVIAVFVAIFLQIRPYAHGNGRLSRVLTQLLLLQAGYAYTAYGSLDAVIEADTAAYAAALQQVQGSSAEPAANWQPWLLFFLRALAEQVRRLEETMACENTGEAVPPGLSALSMQILELARGQGRVTMAEAVGHTGCGRNTLKLHMRRLVATGRLQRHGAGRGIWYEPQP